MDMSCDQSKYHTLMHFLCLISLKPITTLQQYDIQAMIMPKSFTIVIGFMIFEKFSRNYFSVSLVAEARRAWRERDRSINVRSSIGEEELKTHGTYRRKPTNARMVN